MRSGLFWKPALVAVIALPCGCDGFYSVRGRAVTAQGEPLAGARVNVRMAPNSPCDGGWPVREAYTQADGTYESFMVGPFPLGGWDPDALWSVEFNKAGYERACIIVAHVQHRCSNHEPGALCWTVDGVMRLAGTPLPDTPAVPPKPVPEVIVQP
jgi:hypothetical protein